MDRHYYKKIKNTEGANSYEIILAFHGVGQDATVFKKAKAIYPDSCLYSFDLFNHGKSIWHSNYLAYSPIDFKEELNVFFNNERIKTCTVIGFSMGARLTLAVANFFPEKIKKIVLIAPDGIYENFWFKLATSTILGKLLFKNISKRPYFLNIFLPLVGKDKKVVIQKILKTNTLMKVYRTWLLYKGFTFNVKDILLRLHEFQKPVVVVTSCKDKIISAKKIRKKLGKEKLNYIELDVIHNKLLSEFFNSRYFSQFF
ncbi:MAG: alpha/beta hydrolase [Bacteroidota bacterium]